MDLAGVRNSTSVVCERRDGILRRMSTRMPSFLSANFVARLMCRSDKITRERLRRYGQYLYECGLKPNTISTYMRMLRSIYNRGVEAGSAPYVPRLFHDVYTGVDVRQKKALPATELHKLLYEDPKSERLRRTQAIAALMFQFCGMSFR